jgi:16S rRNA (guanine(527)-N(7))-methyltransferase RsmG
MKQKNILSPSVGHAWAALARDYNLDDATLARLKDYVRELVAWNEKTNLTRITQEYEIIEYHLRDSLVFTKTVDCTKPLLVCDVGTGGGLPGIPLKMVYPHLQIILLEVVDKKVAFLNHVITHFGLEGIEVCSLDWRTFLRTIEAPIDYFVARASLRPDELVRVYKPGSDYANAQVVYWAAESWVAGNVESPYLSRVYDYTVGSKARRLVFFALGRQG